MANDPTVKAGSWGARTVEKIVRLTEHALRHELPVVYLVDSAGARITDQVELFPGRRGAGRIFANQVRLSGKVPQVCCLFGPSAAGGAYIPAFCDVGVHGRGQRVDVPRLAAHGRGRDRRARSRSRRWAARACTRPSAAAATTSAPTTTTRSTRPAASSRTCRRTGRCAPPAAAPRRTDRDREADPRRSCRSRSGAPTTCTR